MNRELLVVLGFAEIGVAVGGLILAARLLRRWRDGVLARSWQDALNQRASGLEIVFIRRVYQHARRGSKAIVVWWSTGLRQDAWFAGRQEQPGRYLLLEGSVGWGPHNSNPRVLYVFPGQVRAVLPGPAPHAWRREQQRRLRRHAQLPPSLPGTP